MGVCAEGHQTAAPDFCDQCGLPVTAAPEPVAPAAPVGVEQTACPNCGTARQPGALFCESCGYDFTTGALPTADLRTQLGLPPLPGTEAPDPGTSDAPTPGAAATPVDAPATGSTTPPGDEAAPEEAPVSPDTAPPAIPRVRSGAWVAEVWVDPQWYAMQESDDPLPPQGPPRIVPLRDSALIGRRSVSRNIHPDVDCEPDVGCSRRQAYLTYAQGYWYVNDLDSANGTYVGAASGALPENPITERTQITPDTRVYVGAWTRIVVRPAIEEDTPVTLPGPDS